MTIPVPFHYRACGVNDVPRLCPVLIKNVASGSEVDEQSAVAKLKELHDLRSQEGRARKELEDENARLKAQGGGGEDDQSQQRSGGLQYYEELSEDPDEYRVQVAHNMSVQREAFGQVVGMMQAQAEHIKTLTETLNGQSETSKRSQNLSEFQSRGVDAETAGLILDAIDSDNFEERLAGMDAYKEVAAKSSASDQQRIEQLQTLTKAAGTQTGGGGGATATNEELKKKGWQEQMAVLGEVQNAQGDSAVDAILKTLR